MTVQQQLRDLLQRYCVRLSGQLEILDEVLSTGSSGGAALSAIAEAREMAHEMKGTAGSLGFPDISGAASALDDNLKLLVNQECISPAQLQVSKTLFVQLRKIARQAIPQMSKLYDADLSSPAARPDR
jgi:HPt (histidine-containing phosphotransfer) domain-containing protein